MMRFVSMMLVVLVVLAIPVVANADPEKLKSSPESLPSPKMKVSAAPAATPTVAPDPVPSGTWDVLDELNGQRRARGLQPYIWDRELTMAAGRASKWRAERLQFGHAPSDFAFLSPGVSADAAGCAAYPASYGFMACACYEAGEHQAGAAYTLGSDGKRYCHLFIRRVHSAVKPTVTTTTDTIRFADCPSGSWGTVTRSQSVSQGRWRRR